MIWECEKNRSDYPSAFGIIPGEGLIVLPVYDTARLDMGGWQRTFHCLPYDKGEDPPKIDDVDGYEMRVSWTSTVWGQDKFIKALREETRRMKEERKHTEWLRRLPIVDPWREL